MDGGRKLQVNSLRAVGMKATIQRFNGSTRPIAQAGGNESLRERRTMRDCEARNARQEKIVCWRDFVEC